MKPGRVFLVRSLKLESEWSAREVERETAEINIFRRRTLLAKLQFSGDRLIAVSVSAMQIIQQTTALPHHFEQTTPRVVIFQVLLEVLGQMVDSLGQQRNLDIGRPGVALVNPKICNRFRFFFHTSVTDPFPFLSLTERRV